jgi:3'(2'), 5'-bisphosphate nucleotidase
MTEDLAGTADGPLALVTPDDHVTCRRLAILAGNFLLRAREHPGALKSTIDARAQDLILRRLARAFPRDPVLAEEAPPEPGRLESRRVWIVDPLDGTREYHEPGRSDWAVHVALAVDGKPAAGAVALPARRMTLGSDNARFQVPRTRTGRLVVSRSRPTPEILMLGETLDLDIVRMGSAGAKAMAVVLGEADVYAHAGGQYEWDSAAPAAVAVAAGLHASRLDGSPLRYGQPNPWLPDLLICRSELADRVIQAWLELQGPTNSIT